MSNEPRTKRANPAKPPEEAPASPDAPGDPASGDAADPGDAVNPSSGDEFPPRFRLSKRAALVFGLALPALFCAVNMWRVRRFTIDDAYISYRYARNLARGLGLVYNAGERIEGYTNFLWTVLLAGAVGVGLDPDVVAKILGALSALGALGFTYLLAERWKSFEVLPCFATWLLASSIVFSGYAVFGLETSFFVFLILAGSWLFYRESDAAIEASRAPSNDRRAFLRALPFSGLVFGLAGITRPEAPMYIGILMLFLGRRLFSAQNLLRGALFVLPVACHVLWRRSYYGTWLPNTLSAKTGDLSAQVGWGWDYFQRYAITVGPVLYLALFGVILGYVARRREVLAFAVLAALVAGYIVLVGGDWMPVYRFASPFEPFAFLLVDLAARDIVDRRSRVATLAIAGFAIAVLAYRVDSLETSRKTILSEDRVWRERTEGTTRWLLDHNKPGTLALGDIGYIGYATDYPILDLLGLVDPVISKLPGAYTWKVGPGFTDRLFDVAPRYVLIISENMNCERPSVTGSRVIYKDKRFKQQYYLPPGAAIPVGGGYAWCIYERKAA